MIENLFCLFLCQIYKFIIGIKTMERREFLKKTTI